MFILFRRAFTQARANAKDEISYKLRFIECNMLFIAVFRLVSEHSESDLYLEKYTDYTRSQQYTSMFIN